MLSKNYSNFWQKVIDMVPNSVFYASRRLSQKNMVQLTDVIFSCFFGCWTKYNLLFFQKVSPGFSSKLSACPEQQSEENHIFFKKNSLQFFGFCSKTQLILAKTFQQNCQNCILGGQSKILIWFFSGKKIKFCSTITEIERKIVKFSKQNFGKLFRTAFTCSEVLQFDESVFLMKDFFR